MLLAILPGIPGNKIFIHFAGSDWRLKEWEKISRILIFSVLGIVIYSSFTNLLRLPEPIYIFPSTFKTETLETIKFSDISIAYLGHWLFSGIIGLVFGLIIQSIASKSPSSVYPSSWDVFLRNHISNHWIVVSLSNGESYSGIFSCSDLSVGTEDRDVIIEEPAKFIEKDNNYKSLPYKSLFLPASLIMSIAVLHDPDIDKRITEVGKFIFSGGNDD
jgi:hypothetical protein